MKAVIPKLSPALNISAAAVSVAVLGVVDWRTGYELNFFVFYFAPVAFVAWRVGRLASVLTAVLSAGTWFAADWASGHPYSSPFYACWNTALRLCSFLIIAYFTARTRQLSDQAHATVRRLSGLLPMCAWCKKVRNDAGYWQEVEQYLQEQSGAEFTHSICEECSRKGFPED